MESSTGPDRESLNSLEQEEPMSPEKSLDDLKITITLPLATVVRLILWAHTKPYKYKSPMASAIVCDRCSNVDNWEGVVKDLSVMADLAGEPLEDYARSVLKEGFKNQSEVNVDTMRLDRLLDSKADM